MVTHSDEEMTEVLKDWKDKDGEQPIIDLDDIDYNQFLVEFLDLEEEKPKEVDDESSKQLECYMNCKTLSHHERNSRSLRLTALPPRRVM